MTWWQVLCKQNYFLGDFDMCRNSEINEYLVMNIIGPVINNLSFLGQLRLSTVKHNLFDFLLSKIIE